MALTSCWELAGYEDAFSSLAAFIAQLNGCGALVASARSAFFDYNGFRENAERYSGDGTLSYDIEPVKIEPWSDQDARGACKAADA